MTKSIVPATEPLIAEIEVWLIAEEEAYQVAKKAWVDGDWEGDEPVRGFLVNWELVKRNWREENSQVDVLLVDGKAVGFLWGTDIVEIHPGYRGRHLGVLMADFMLNRAKDEGLSVLNIEIAPATAESFWLGQGYAIIDPAVHHLHGTRAYLIIERSFTLGDGPRVPVEISFHAESTLERDPPFVTFEGEGERLPDGSIQLPERVHGFDPLQNSQTEHHIKIVVDGEEVYFGRSKYGRDHGASRDPYGYHFIDKIIP